MDCARIENRTEHEEPSHSALRLRLCTQETRDYPLCVIVTHIRNTFSVTGGTGWNNTQLSRNLLNYLRLGQVERVEHQKVL